MKDEKLEEKLKACLAEIDTEMTQAIQSNNPKQFVNAFSHYMDFFKQFKGHEVSLELGQRLENTFKEYELKQPYFNFSDVTFTNERGFLLTNINLEVDYERLIKEKKIDVKVDEFKKILMSYICDNANQTYSVQPTKDINKVYDITFSNGLQGFLYHKEPYTLGKTGTTLNMGK